MSCILGLLSSSFLTFVLRTKKKKAQSITLSPKDHLCLRTGQERKKKVSRDHFSNLFTYCNCGCTDKSNRTSVERSFRLNVIDEITIRFFPNQHYINQNIADLRKQNIFKAAYNVDNRINVCTCMG